jgi:GntR family transcriptional regulator, transcriptional repressor for pyruvate dehydrogenase complex
MPSRAGTSPPKSWVPTVPSMPKAGGHRLSDAVAASLLTELTSGAVAAGERLPPERELGIRFGVSRTVIRDAIQALAARGVIVVRPGAGIFVANAHASAATESLRLLVRGSDELSYEQVYEVRATIEVRVAGLAAERATDQEVDRLRAALAQLEAAVTGEEHAVADGEFHLTLASLAHNPLYRVLLEAVGDLMMDVRRGSAYLPGARERITADHRRIVDAVATREPAAAREAMEEHLSHSREIVRSLDETLSQSRARRAGPA